VIDLTINPPIVRCFAFHVIDENMQNSNLLP
jgi:hypothetical protein